MRYFFQPRQQGLFYGILCSRLGRLHSCVVLMGWTYLLLFRYYLNDPDEVTDLLYAINEYAEKVRSWVIIRVIWDDRSYACAPPLWIYCQILAQAIPRTSFPDLSPDLPQFDVSIAFLYRYICPTGSTEACLRSALVFSTFHLVISNGSLKMVIPFALAFFLPLECRLFVTFTCCNM